MRRTIFAAAFIAAAILASPIPVFSQTGDTATMNGYSLSQYPDFQKKWHLDTTRYRKDSGEMRLTYANDLAWDALQKHETDYPDGAVFAKIGMITQEDPAFVTSAVPSGARRYQLMVRNKEKHKDTYGRGYALFKVDGTATYTGDDVAPQSQACSACHEMVPERGYVFSQPMTLAVGDDAVPVSHAPAKNGLYFTTEETADAEIILKENMPPKFKAYRRLHGGIEERAFGGTMGEIRPTLIKEMIKTKLPAALVSKDGELLSLTYINPDTQDCVVSGGKKGVHVISLFSAAPRADKKIPLSRNTHCEALP